MSVRSPDVPEARSLRLLVLLEQVKPTGLVRQLVELLDRLRPRGVDVLLVCIARRGMDAAALGGMLDARGIPHRMVTERFPFDPGSLRRLRTTARTWKPDVVQTHGYKTGALAWALRRSLRVPWVAFYHGRTNPNLKVRLYHAFERMAMRRAAAVVTVAEGVEHHLARADRNRVQVVPNGVVPLGVPRRSGAQVRADLEIPADGLVAGFVGRLSEEKGPDLFLRALGSLQHDTPRFVGLVVGDGPWRKRLETQARTLPGAVRFTGRVDDVAEMYEAMDVLVLPSRSEVFPNVLLEGVDAGIPVAASAVGGVSEIAEGLPSVCVVEAGDPVSLGRAVRAAVDTSSAATAESRERIRRRYTQERRVEAALSVYDSVVSSRRPATSEIKST